MEYLHSIQPHPVIHGDLKVQNILVGDGLVAKVCVIVYFVIHDLIPIGSPITVTIWSVVFANKSGKLGWIWMKLDRCG